MCIFSQQISRVSRTAIFARLDGAEQYLVYEMSLSVATDVAMILPLPIAHAGDGDAIRFISLKDYVRFFPDLDRCFPRPPTLSSDDSSLLAVGAAPTLEVHRVGAFDASFVPTMRDFARLDRRFTLPESVWESLPMYQDYGFAVFQLRAGDAQVHPMALCFGTRDPDAAFFPTVHVHDRTVPGRARFDHALYVQGCSRLADGWRTGEILPSEVMALRHQLKGDLTRGTVAASLPVSRRFLRGDYPNQDVWAGREPRSP